MLIIPFQKTGFSSCCEMPIGAAQLLFTHPKKKLATAAGAGRGNVAKRKLHTRLVHVRWANLGAPCTLFRIAGVRTFAAVTAAAEATLLYAFLGVSLGSKYPFDIVARDTSSILAGYSLPASQLEVSTDIFPSILK